MKKNIFLRDTIDFVLTAELNIGEKLAYIKRYPSIFKHMTNPNAKTSDGKPRTSSIVQERVVQDNAIGASANNIQYIPNPTYDQKYLAVWKRPILIKHFNDEPELVRLAISRYSDSEPLAKYLDTDKLTEQQIDILVRKNPKNFKYVKQTRDRQKKFISQYGNNYICISYIDNIHRDHQLNLVQYALMYFALIKKPSSKVLRYIRTKAPHYLSKSQIPLPRKMCQELIRQDPTNLRDIPRPIPEEYVLEAFEAARWLTPDHGANKNMPYIPEMTLPAALLIARICPQHLACVPWYIKNTYNFQKVLMNTYLNTIVFENKGLTPRIFENIDFTNKIQTLISTSSRLKEIYPYVSNPNKKLLEKAYNAFLTPDVPEKDVRKIILDVLLKHIEPTEEFIAWVQRDYSHIDIWDRYRNIEWNMPVHILNMLIRHYDTLPIKIAELLYKNHSHPDGEEATREFKIFLRMKYGFQ